MSIENNRIIDVDTFNQWLYEEYCMVKREYKEAPGHIKERLRREYKQYKMGMENQMERTVLEEDCRLQIIKTMIASGFLKNNVLGSGYTDYHDEDDNCCLALVFKSGEVFDLVIKRRAE